MKAVAIIVLAIAICTAAFADTYIWTDSNGRKNYSDRAPVGVLYKTVAHPKPVDVPVVEKKIYKPVSFEQPQVAFQVDHVAREMRIAQAASEIKERDRSKSRECISLQQTISRLSSSRNRSVDPDTGGSLEESRARETQQMFDALCR